MYFSDDSQDDYSDENDDYDEEDGDMYSDEEGEEDDYDNGKTYTLTVGFVTQRLDTFWLRRLPVGAPTCLARMKYTKHFGASSLVLHSHLMCSLWTIAGITRFWKA